MWLKANPDKATAGTVGIGSPSHVSGIYFQNETGTRFQFVPYRGGAPLTTRWSAAPDIPTIDEAGVRGLHISLWNGLWVPKATPKDIIGKLNAAIVQALADATVRQRMADIGFEIPAREQQTPEALAAFHQAEIDKWWPIIKAANIKVE